MLNSNASRRRLLGMAMLLALAGGLFADQLTLTVDDVEVGVGNTATVTIRYNYVQSEGSPGLGGAGFYLAYDHTVATLKPATAQAGVDEFLADSNANVSMADLNPVDPDRYEISVMADFYKALLNESGQGVFLTFEMEVSPDADPDADDFVFVTSDAYGGNANGVGITVLTVNGAVDIVRYFNAADATIATNEDTPAQKDLSGLFTDEDKKPIAGRVTAVTDPDSGTVTLNEGIVTYTPDPDFNGTDTFVYTAENADGTYTDTGTVTVTVAAVNDPPVNAVAPSITGTFQYNEVLTAAPGTWNDNKDYPAGGAPEITYSYEWWTSTEADGTRTADAIEGATTNTLTVPSGVAGKYLAVKVTATDGGNPGTATVVAWSAWTLVAKAPATVTVTDPNPTYDGTPQQATVTTVPAELPVDVTYTPGTTAPVDAGTYGVAATINHPDYAGTGNGTLTIKKAGLTIAAGDATRNYFALNSTIEYSPTFTLTDGVSRTALLGDDTTEEFQGILEFGTDASDDPSARSPWDVAYKTTVVISEQNLGELPAKNYEIAFADGVLTIDKGSAPYANGKNGPDTEKRQIVVSGTKSQFDLKKFFEDDDKALGDALVFSEIADVTLPDGVGPVGIAFVGRAGGVVEFNPLGVTQGAGAPVPISFTVKVFDSALDSDGRGLPLAGTEDGKTTIYLSLLDNQAPDLDWAGTSESPVNEGDTIQIAVQATETPEHKPGPDDIASITVKVKKNGVDVDVTPTVVLDGKTGTLTYSVPTDEETSSFAADTVYDIEIVATDAAGAVATETRQITVANVNVPPTIDGIANLTVQEDSEDLDPILLTGVSNGGEDNDPRIAVGSVPSRFAGTAITATTDRPDIVDSITLEEIVSEVRGSGDPQSFKLTYTLAEDAHGVATVTVTVNDGSGVLADRGTEAVVEKSFAITVQPVNDPPMNTEAPSITGTPHVGRPLTANPGLWNDTKDLAWPTGDVTRPVEWITYTYQWQVLGGSPDRITEWTDIPEATGQTFTPTIAQNGRRVQVVVTATDRGYPLPAATASMQSEADVLIANVAPVFADGDTKGVWGFEDNETVPARKFEPRSFDFVLGATDGDEDTLIWSIAADPANGTATVDADGNVLYVPDQDYYNTGSIPGEPVRDDPDSFVVQVDDGLGGTAQITVNVTVVAVNDAPVVDSVALDAKDAGGNSASLGEPGNIAKIVAAVTVSDVDDDTFAYDYNWTVERDGVVTPIATAAVPELTTADLGTAGLAAFFIKDDKITVIVDVTDSGGGQLHNTPAEKTARGNRTVSLGSPGWYPQVVVPLDEKRETDLGIASFVQVRIEDGAVYDRGPATVLTAILAQYRGATELVLRPEDYMTGDGPGSMGLLPGVHMPFFSYWNEETGEFGPEVPGTPFTVAYEEPEAPTAVDVRAKATPAVAVQPGGASFSFRLPIAQGYILEIRTAAGALVERLVRPLSRPDGDSAFPVTLNVVDLFVGLAVGDYTWQVRAYNPLVPADETEAPRAANWFVGDAFSVTEAAPAGAPAAPVLFSPGDGIVFNPSPTTVKAALDFFWSAVPGATQYIVYIGLEEGIAVVSNEVTADSEMLAVPLGPGTYRWAVRARNATGKSLWSEVGTFQVSTGPGPGLIAGNCIKVDNEGNPIDPTIVFESFGLVPTGVDLYILDAGTYAAWLVANLDLNGGYVLTGNMALPGHTYWFKTRSVAANGDRGAWSPWGLYQIEAPKDEVTVAAANIASAAGEQVTFTWNWPNGMPAGSQVKVRIMRAADYVFFLTTDATGGDALVLTDPAVTVPGLYYYQLRPLDADGEPLNDWTEWLPYTIANPLP